MKEKDKFGGHSLYTPVRKPQRPWQVDVYFSLVFAEYFAELYGSVGDRLAFLMMFYAGHLGLSSCQSTTGQFRRRGTAMS